MDNINYTLVSEGAILRDYITPEYINEEHERLVDIADTLYNANIPVEDWNDNPNYNYKALYNKYGKEYWDKVLKDMSAIDSQLTGDRQRDDLILDYNDSLEQLK